MEGIAFEFRNGRSSITDPYTSRVSALTNTWPKVRKFKVDSWGLRKDIIFVSMRMRDSSEYTGIRFYYRKKGLGTVGVDENIWSEDPDGEWSAPAAIPEG